MFLPYLSLINLCVHIKVTIFFKKTIEIWNSWERERCLNNKSILEKKCSSYVLERAISWKCKFSMKNLAILQIVPHFDNFRLESILFKRNLNADFSQQLVQFLHLHLTFLFLLDNLILSCHWTRLPAEKIFILFCNFICICWSTSAFYFQIQDLQLYYCVV